MDDPSPQPGYQDAGLSATVAPDHAGHLLNVAQFRHPADVVPKEGVVRWDKLVERLTTHPERSKKETDLWSPITYREGSTRSKTNVELVYALSLDVDERTPDWERLKGVEFCAHTTWSHLTKNSHNRSGGPCWRVVIPLAHPVPAAQYDDFWARAKYHLIPWADEAARDASRMMFWPGHPAGQPADHRYQAGVLLDPTAVPQLPPELRPTPPPQRQPNGQVGGRPGDDFNTRGDWATLLAEQEWEFVRASGGEEYWRRPGKDEGISATVGYMGHDVLHVFTSSAPPLEANENYSKFQFYTVTKHGGDWGVAAAALREEGYGTAAAAAKDVREARNGEGFGPAISAADIPEPGPRQWVIDGLVPAKWPTIVYGDGGVGKSTLATHLSCCVATGTPWHGREAHPCPVLFTDAELDQEEFAARMWPIARGLGLRSPPRDVHYWRIPKALSRDDVQEHLYLLVAQHGIGLIIVDSLTLATHLSDQNVAGDISQLVFEMTRRGVATVFLDHHARQYGAQDDDARVDPYGTVMKRNLSRSAIYVTEYGTGLIRLRANKVSFTAKWDPFVTEVRFAGTHPTSTITYSPVAANDPRLVEAKGRNDTEQLVDAIQDVMETDDHCATFGVPTDRLKPLFPNLNEDALRMRCNRLTKTGRLVKTGRSSYAIPTLLNGSDGGE